MELDHLLSRFSKIMSLTNSNILPIQILFILFENNNSWVWNALAHVPFLTSFKILPKLVDVWIGTKLAGQLTLQIFIKTLCSKDLPGSNILKLITSAMERNQQSTRWQHLSRLKASVFFSLQKKFCCYETQQLILWTGTAIWWMTEPHW